MEKKSVSDNSAGIILTVLVLFWLVCGLGYVINIVKLANLDFKSPYKAEIIRGVGVFSGIGAVTGYLNIKDN